MKHARAVTLLFLCLAGGCSQRGAPPPPEADGTCPAERASAPRYGALMAEVGRRFELAGRASIAGRFELASFEVEEIEELFEEDLPAAELPKEGATAKLPALAEAFVKTHPPELKKAASAKDRAAFAAAFQRAAGTCNGCHQASDHAFIEIPSVPGKPVPDVETPAAKSP